VTNYYRRTRADVLCVSTHAAHTMTVPLDGGDGFTTAEALNWRRLFEAHRSRDLIRSGHVVVRRRFERGRIRQFRLFLHRAGCALTASVGFTSPRADTQGVLRAQDERGGLASVTRTLAFDRSRTRGGPLPGLATSVSQGAVGHSNRSPRLTDRVWRAQVCWGAARLRSRRLILRPQRVPGVDFLRTIRS
jgi:hypothetical protein